MTRSESVGAEGAALPEPIRTLLASRTPGDLSEAVEALVRRREQRLFLALGRLARDLHESASGLAHAIASGEGETRDVPDARKHLHEALGMSERAAHRSLDVGERLLHRAEALARAAAPVDGNATSAGPLAAAAAAFAESCREDIRELVLAQSWQDLTGQRLQRVAGFLGRIEASILELVRLAGSIGAPGLDLNADPARRLATQEQVDRLLNELGF